MATFARAEWSVWSTTALLIVTDPAAILSARQILEAVLADVDAACSRFRADSELARVRERLRTGVTVSPTLATLVQVALDAAELTNGIVDPTLGRELVEMGYDRDIAQLRQTGPEDRFEVTTAQRRSVWRDITLVQRRLRVPAPADLDLGATAKAFAADHAANLIASQLGTGVLVGLGGDIATAGDQPSEGWSILVEDQPGDPSQVIMLPAGAAIATSSTQKRRWAAYGYARHHILDPATGLPVDPVWRTATVTADTCVRANALSTAAIVRGRQAPRWLGTRAAHARLVTGDGRVITTGKWPAPTAEESPSERTAAIE